MSALDAAADAGWLATAYGLDGPASAGGAGPGLVAIARGAMGQVWRLTVSDRVYAAKELFHDPPGEDGLAAELDLARRGRACGLASPPAVTGADGSVLQRHPVTGRTWRLYDWVAGRPVAGGDPGAAVWLARGLARLHRVAPRTDDRPDPWYTSVTADWPALAESALAEGFPWAAQLARRAPELEELSARVAAAPGAGWRLIGHRDASALNVLAEPDGTRWLVDWDNAGPIDPAHELGRLVQDHYRDDVVVRGLVRAYLDEGGPATLDPADLMTAAQAIWLNYLAEVVETLLAGAGGEAAEFAEQGLVLLGVMPSPAQLEHTLRVVATVSGPGAS